METITHETGESVVLYTCSSHIQQEEVLEALLSTWANKLCYAMNSAIGRKIAYPELYIVSSRSLAILSDIVRRHSIAAYVIMNATFMHVHGKSVRSTARECIIGR